MSTLLNPHQHGAGVRICTDTDQLSQIHEPEVEVVLWLREVSPLLASFLDNIDISSEPRNNFHLQQGKLHKQLHEHLQSFEVNNPDVYQAWLNDMAYLVDVYQEVVSNPSPRVRLDFLHNNACKRFHRDNMTIRLITTYIGPGTEWLLGEHLKVGPERTDIFKVQDVQHVPRFTVGLFKGLKYPGNLPKVFHRSPPISGSNQHRFVLCLDDIPAPSTPHT